MQVLLVTGGKSSKSRFLSSTEIYWDYDRVAGFRWISLDLHSRRAYMPAITLDNSVFIFGQF